MKEGWEYKKLGEIATEMYRGSGIKRDQVTKEGTPCVRYGEIYTTYNISFDTCASHTKIENVTSPKYFEYGDLLFAITGESVEDIGKTIAYLGDEKCLCGGDIICMKHHQNPKYLAYALSTPDAIRQKGIGKTKLKVVHTNAPALKAINIPLAPLSEQQSIVDYLDAAFAKIDAMKANAEKALNEAKALFQASLKEMLEPKEGWEEKKLCEVVNIINGYAFPSKAFGDNQELKVVKITNVGVGTFIEDISTLPNKMFIQDVCLKEGDIVIALTRTIISDGLKRAIIPSSYDGAMLNQRVASLRYSGNINMSFLYYYLGCSLVSDYVWLHVNTLMQPNLSIKDLKDLPVCNPPFSEQQSIVETLDSLKSKVDRLQENYNKISKECDAFKQAILRQVFE